MTNITARARRRTAWLLTGQCAPWLAVALMFLGMSVPAWGWFRP